MSNIERGIKEMEKKNIIIGIAVVIIIILLGIIIKQSKDNAEIKQQIADIKNEIGIESKEDNKQVKEISKEEFKKYIKQVDITTDNWKDYIDIECGIEDEKNSFGDITASYNYTQFKLTDKYYNIGMLDDVVLEVEIPKDKGLILVDTIVNTRIIEFNSNNKSFRIFNNVWLKNDETTITLDEIKCIRAKGQLYYLDNIPEEYWIVGDDIIEGENKYINVEGRRRYIHDLKYSIENE